MIDAGKAMQVDITFEAPAMLSNAPRSVMQRYDRIQRPMAEEVCAENNEHLFDYHIRRRTSQIF